MSGEPSALNPLPQQTMMGGAEDPGQMQWLRSLVVEKPSSNEAGPLVGRLSRSGWGG
jgi:hypothetical protein